MKTNLLLLDSYNNIENLISLAFSFSRQYNSKLKIVYVFDFEWMRQSYMVGTAGPVDPSLVAVERNARKEFDVAESKIKEIAAEYTKKNSSEVPYEVNVSEFNRIDVVNDEWEKNKNLILIVSTHQSYTEASGGLIGYPNIIDHVLCPVFAVPEDNTAISIKNVVYATDYHEEDINVLKHLYGYLSEGEASRITVMHNAETLNFVEKLKWVGLQELVKEEVGVENIDFKLETDKDVEEGIQDYIDEFDTDLLVVLKEKKGFFKRIFSSSDTKSILTKFKKPVLVYHE